jgi:hypothetical protein
MSTPHVGSGRARQQLGQPRNIDRNAARLVVGQHLGLQRVIFHGAAVDIGNRLTVCVRTTSRRRFSRLSTVARL